MSDLLGEALAWYDKRRVICPWFYSGNGRHIVAAARNWHTLTNPTDELIDRLARVRFLQGEGTEAGWERNKAELRGGPEPDRAVVETMRRHRTYVRELVDALTDTADE